MSTLFMQRSGELTIDGSIERSGLPIVINESREDLDSLIVLIGSLDRSGSGKYHLNKIQINDLDQTSQFFDFGDLIAVQDYVENRLDLIKKRSIFDD